MGIMLWAINYILGEIFNIKVCMPITKYMYRPNKRWFKNLLCFEIYRHHFLSNRVAYLCPEVKVYLAKREKRTKLRKVGSLKSSFLLENLSETIEVTQKTYISFIKTHSQYFQY